jgi:hypothetical protein
MKHCVVIGFLLSCAACGDDAQLRLNEALKSEADIKSVAVTDAKVTATCKEGATVDVDTAELDRNFLGMVKSEKVRDVANKLFKQCEQKNKEVEKAAALKGMIADTAKQLGIDVSALDDNAAKKTICDKLTTQLPIKDPERTVEDAKNQNKWGCAPAPPVTDLPTGAWQVEAPDPKAKVDAKKPAVPTYARLVGANGERLTIRCANKKADVYLQVNDPLKKGAKTVDAKLANAPKPQKWKVKPSTDGKALFFVDVKPTVKAMESADNVVITVPGAKKSSDVALSTKGLGEAMKKMPKECQ